MNAVHSQYFHVIIIFFLTYFIYFHVIVFFFTLDRFFSFFLFLNPVTSPPSPLCILCEVWVKQALISSRPSQMLARTSELRIWVWEWKMARPRGEKSHSESLCWSETQEARKGKTTEYMNIWWIYDLPHSHSLILSFGKCELERNWRLHVQVRTIY